MKRQEAGLDRITGRSPETGPSATYWLPPGFEEEDSSDAETQAISEKYEEQVQTLLDSVEAAVKSVTPAETLPALEKQVEDVAASVTAKGLASYFPRELRDLDDAREKLVLTPKRLIMHKNLCVGAF